jgi:hypothetical protein
VQYLHILLKCVWLLKDIDRKHIHVDLLFVRETSVLYTNDLFYI